MNTPSATPIKIRFLRHCRVNSAVYGPMDAATFAPDEALRLVKGRHAQFVEAGDEDVAQHAVDEGIMHAGKGDSMTATDGEKSAPKTKAATADRNKMVGSAPKTKAAPKKK